MLSLSLKQRAEKIGDSDYWLTILFELESNYLDVVLVPAPDKRHSGHCVRMVQYQNCGWYREFCAEHPSASTSSTKIKRIQTIRAINKIIDNEFDNSIYLVRLIDFFERLKLKDSIEEDVCFKWLL